MLNHVVGRCRKMMFRLGWWYVELLIELAGFSLARLLALASAGEDACYNTSNVVMVGIDN